MARMSKVLTAADDAIILPSTQSYTYIGVQYGTGGLGTIVLEATCAPASSADWFAVQLQDPSDAATPIASLAAAGAGYARAVFHQYRVRKSVAGGGPVTVHVNLADN